MAATWSATVAPSGLDCVPGLVTLTRPLLTAQLNAWLAVVPPSDTVAVTANVPDAVGVPAMTPVVELIDSPAGRPLAP